MLVLLVPVAALLALPLVIENRLASWAARHGVAATADRVKLNPFTQQVAFAGLRIGRGPSPALEVAELRADLNRDALLAGRLEVGALAARGARVNWQAAADALSALPAYGTGGDALPEFGGIELHELALANTSARLGQPVRLVRASVEPQRAAGAAAPIAAFAIELSGEVGPAPFTVSGRLSFGPGAASADGDLLAFDGEFTADAVSLAGFQRLWPAASAAVPALEGRLTAAGEVSARLTPATGLARVRVDARAGVTELRGELAPAAAGRALNLANGALDFAGVIEASRGAAGAPIEFGASGVLSAPHIALGVPASGRAGGHTDIGELGELGELMVTLDGALVDGSLKLVRTAGAAGPELSARIDAERVGATAGGADGLLELSVTGIRGELAPQPPPFEDGFTTRLSWLRAASAKARLRSSPPIELEGIALDEAGFVQGGLSMGEARVQRATTPSAAGGSGAGPVAGLSIDALSVSGLRVARARGERFALVAGSVSAKLAQAVLAGEAWVASEPRFTRLERNAGGRLSAARVGAAWLRAGGHEGGSAFSVEQPSFEQVRIRSDGGLAVRAVSAKSVEQAGNPPTAWSLTDVTLGRLSARPGGQLTIQSAGAREARARTGGASLSGAGLALGPTKIVLAPQLPEGGGQAPRPASVAGESVAMARLSLRLPSGVRLTVDGAGLVRPVYDPAGGLTLDTASARRLEARGADTGVLVLSRLRLGPLSGAFGGGESAPRFDLVSLAARTIEASAPDGARYTFESSKLSDVAVTPGGLSGASASHDAFAWNAGDGSGRAEAVRMTDLRIEGPLHADASVTRIATIDANSGRERWRMSGVRSDGFGWRGGRLLSDRLQARSLSFHDGRGAGDAVTFELSDVDGEAFGWGLSDLPEASYLSAARLTGTVGARGRFSVGPLAVRNARRNGGPALNVDTVSAAGLSIDDDRIRSRLSAARALAADAVFESTDAVRAGRVVLESLRVEQGAGPPLSMAVGELAVDGLAARYGQSTAARDVTLAGFDINVGIDAQGRWQWPRAPGTNPEPVRAASRSHLLRVNSLRTVGAARIRAFDDGISPRFTTELSRAAAEVGGYDGSGLSGPARFKLEGRLGEYGSLRFRGTMLPRPGDHLIEATGRLQGLSLPRLDAYTRTYLDTQVRGGRGDARVTLRVDDSVVDGEAALTLTNLDLRSVGQVLDESGRPSGTSVASSLALLEDNDGVVRLTVPFNGPIRDPQLRVSRLFGKALVKTVQAAIGVTFKPVSFLLGLTELLAGGQPSEFAAVSFQPGDSGLSAQAQSDLDAVGRELGRHPRVNLRVCGIATEVDDAWRREHATEEGSGDNTFGALLELAQSRSENVRRFLAERHGLAESRLPDCAPAFEPGADMRPRVKLEVRTTTRRNRAPAQDPLFERESSG